MMESSLCIKNIGFNERSRQRFTNSEHFKTYDSHECQIEISIGIELWKYKDHIDVVSTINKTLKLLPFAKAVFCAIFKTSG